MSIELAREVLAIEAEAIAALSPRIGENFEKAVGLIMRCPTRVIIAGIGKSGIIGQKIAATLNSTGTPAFFLHPVEAMHGDLGIVDGRDVVLAISYSGETLELNTLIASLKNRGTPIIAMTGNSASRLALSADVVLDIAVPREACPLGLAPTASTTATLAMGDALAVVLLDRKKFKDSDFRRNHPGGSLGDRLKVEVADVMLTGERIPQVSEETTVTEAIEVLNQKNLGAVLVVSPSKKVIGILTDGDFRRLFAGRNLSDTMAVARVMTRNPKAVHQNQLAADALSIMQQHEVTILPVIDREDRLLGILHLHDLLGKGEFRLLV